MIACRSFLNLSSTRIVGMLMEWKFVRRDPACCPTLQKLHHVLHERHRLLPYAWKAPPNRRGILAKKPLREAWQMCRPRGTRSPWADDLMWRGPSVETF